MYVIEQSVAFQALFNNYTTLKNEAEALKAKNEALEVKNQDLSKENLELKKDLDACHTACIEILNEQKNNIRLIKENI